MSECETVDRWSESKCAVDHTRTSLALSAHRVHDTLGLPLAPHVGLELRKYRQHPEEGTTCGSRHVDALLEHTQVGAEDLDLVSNVGEVAQRPTEAIKRRVTWKRKPPPSK